MPHGQKIHLRRPRRFTRPRFKQGVWRLANPSAIYAEFAGDQRRDGTSMATPCPRHERHLNGPILGGEVSLGHLCSPGPAGCQAPSPPLRSRDAA